MKYRASEKANHRKARPALIPSPIVPKLNSSERKNIFRERLLRARGCFARAEVICTCERLFCARRGNLRARRDNLRARS